MTNYHETRQELFDELMLYCALAHDIRNLYPCHCAEEAEDLINKFQQAVIEHNGKS